MTTKAWGNEYRATIVCVDSYENGVLAGRFFNPYLDAGQKFESLSRFLFQMEAALDTMNFPQAYSTARTFAELPRQRAGPSGAEVQKGRLATFLVKVLFRQNASWQGSVVWQEGGKEQSFRSVLELIFLMNSALIETSEYIA